MRTALFWVITQRVVAISYPMGPAGCPVTPVQNYHYSIRNNLELTYHATEATNHKPRRVYYSHIRHDYIPEVTNTHKLHKIVVIMWGTRRINLHATSSIPISTSPSRPTPQITGTNHIRIFEVQYPIEIDYVWKSSSPYPCFTIV
jgi:hypothetical protein